MFHDLCSLVVWGGFGSFIVILALIWAVERVVTAFINRNKPECNCDCCTNPDNDEDEDEVVAMGGQVEEHHSDEEK